MSEGPSLKPLIWVGSSREDFREFPEPVQDRMGYALYVAQRGGKHRDSKPLSGFGGAGVLEVIEDFSRRHISRGIRRAPRRGRIRSSRLSEEIEDRSRDPRRDIELIHQRLREAEQIAKERER